MGDIVAFPQVRAKDGGKERIVSRRRRLGLNEPFRGEDLTQDHADPELQTSAHEVVDLLTTAQQLPCDCA